MKNLRNLLLLGVLVFLSGCLTPALKTDQDGDGWTVEDGDCDDSKEDVYPNASDVLKDCNNENDFLVLENEILLAKDFVTEKIAGKLNDEYFSAINATKLFVEDANITDLKFVVDASTIPSEQANRPDTLGVGIYIGIFDQATQREKKRYTRYLDVGWKGNCSIHLDFDRTLALKEGGVYYFGQNRRIEFSDGNLIVSKETSCMPGTEELKLLEILKSAKINKEFIRIGFYSSAPTFGLIKEAKIIYRGGKISVQE